MQIRIYENVSQQPNGDRDPLRHDCFGYEVVLVNGDRRKVVFQNDQFDTHWCAIRGTREGLLNEAMCFAEDLAKTLGAAEIVGISLTKYEKQIIELEASIERDQALLAELKRKVL